MKRKEAASPARVRKSPRRPTGSKHDGPASSMNGKKRRVLRTQPQDIHKKNKPKPKLQIEVHHEEEEEDIEDVDANGTASMEEEEEDSSRSSFDSALEVRFLPRWPPPVPPRTLLLEGKRMEVLTQEWGNGHLDVVQSSSDEEFEFKRGKTISHPGSPVKNDQDDYEVSPYRPNLALLKEGDPGSKTGRPIRLYSDGIWDLFHFGHARALEQAKKCYPNVYLMVGCCSDKVTHQYKGITVMNEKERYESLRHCRWVDQVIEDAPWVVTDDFLEKHQIDYVCHDALPYVDTSGQSSDGDVYHHLRVKGKFLETMRTEGISTSDIIMRMIQNYDEYVMRQMQRGYSCREMKIPYLKEKELLWKRDIQKFQTSTKIGKTLTDIQQSFLAVFDRNSGLRTRLRLQRRSLKARITELAKASFC